MKEIQAGASKDTHKIRVHKLAIVQMQETRRTCMRRLGRMPPPRGSPAIPIPGPGPVEEEDTARCCSPADCSHRAITASPESPAADDAAAAVAAAAPPPPPPRCDRFCGASSASGPARGGYGRARDLELLQLEPRSGGDEQCGWDWRGVGAGRVWGGESELVVIEFVVGLQGKGNLGDRLQKGV